MGGVFYHFNLFSIIAFIYLSCGENETVSLSVKWQEGGWWHVPDHETLFCAITTGALFTIVLCPHSSGSFVLSAVINEGH